MLRARGAWEETRPEVGSQRGLRGLDTLWRVESLAREQEELSRVLCEQDYCQMGLRSSARPHATLSPSPVGLDCSVVIAAAADKASRDMAMIDRCRAVTTYITNKKHHHHFTQHTCLVSDIVGYPSLVSILLLTHLRVHGRKPRRHDSAPKKVKHWSLRHSSFHLQNVPRHPIGGLIFIRIYIRPEDAHLQSSPWSRLGGEERRAFPRCRSPWRASRRFCRLGAGH
jgi:hypothetical protein